MGRCVSDMQSPASWRRSVVSRAYIFMQARSACDLGAIAFIGGMGIVDVCGMKAMAP
jgi:nitrous oxide reductase accessory protein NosL